MTLVFQTQAHDHLASGKVICYTYISCFLWLHMVDREQSSMYWHLMSYQPQGHIIYLSFLQYSLATKHTFSSHMIPLTCLGIEVVSPIFPIRESMEKPKST